VVQSEEREQFGRCLQLLVSCEAVLISRGCFLVLVHGFRVEVLDDEQIDRNASLVSMTGPLGILPEPLSQRLAEERRTYHAPGLLILLDIEILVELIDALLFQPLLGICELAVCASHVEFPGSEVSAALYQPRSFFMAVGDLQQRAIVMARLSVDTVWCPPPVFF
jgi:hypothetical protein